MFHATPQILSLSLDATSVAGDGPGTPKSPGGTPSIRPVLIKDAAGNALRPNQKLLHPTPKLLNVHNPVLGVQPLGARPQSAGPSRYAAKGLAGIGIGNPVVAPAAARYTTTATAHHRTPTTTQLGHGSVQYQFDFSAGAGPQDQKRQTPQPQRKRSKGDSYPLQEAMARTERERSTWSGGATARQTSRERMHERVALGEEERQRRAAAGAAGKSSSKTSSKGSTKPRPMGAQAINRLHHGQSASGPRVRTYTGGGGVQVDVPASPRDRTDADEVGVAAGLVDADEASSLLRRKVNAPPSVSERTLAAMNHHPLPRHDHERSSGGVRSARRGPQRAPLSAGERPGAAAFGKSPAEFRAAAAAGSYSVSASAEVDPDAGASVSVDRPEEPRGQQPSSSKRRIVVAGSGFGGASSHASTAATAQRSGTLGSRVPPQHRARARPTPNKQTTATAGTPPQLSPRDEHAQARPHPQHEHRDEVSHPHSKHYRHHAEHAGHAPSSSGHHFSEQTAASRGHFRSVGQVQAHRAAVAGKRAAESGQRPQTKHQSTPSAGSLRKPTPLHEPARAPPAVEGRKEYTEKHRSAAEPENPSAEEVTAAPIVTGAPGDMISTDQTAAPMRAESAKAKALALQRRRSSQLTGMKNVKRVLVQGSLQNVMFR